MFGREQRKLDGLLIETMLEYSNYNLLSIFLNVTLWVDIEFLCKSETFVYHTPCAANKFLNYQIWIIMNFRKIIIRALELPKINLGVVTERSIIFCSRL